jgi:hypothetical protein
MTMYQVTITMQALDPTNKFVKYKPVRYQGIFIPKKKTEKKEIIEQLVIDKLEKAHKEDHPELNFEFKNIVIKKLRHEFWVAQD